jgi:hypothetical protein
MMKDHYNINVLRAVGNRVRIRAARWSSALEAALVTAERHIRWPRKRVNDEDQQTQTNFPSVDLLLRLMSTDHGAKEV